MKPLDLLSSFAHRPHFPENDVEVSTVTFTIPENLRVSQHEDLIPAFEYEPSVPPTARRFQIVRWALVPFEEAPAILESNMDYDEGNIAAFGNSSHSKPMPDSASIPLEVIRETKDAVGGKYRVGDVALDELHEGWFGIGRNVLPAEMYVGSTVTIRKLTPPLEEDEEPESGFVRFHATWLDAEGAKHVAHIPTQEKNEFDGEQAPHNLVGVMYGPDATIPANAQIWMEGVAPGKVTLEWRAEGGNFDVSFEQTFEVTSHRSKDEWLQVCRERLYLMHYAGGDVDIKTLRPSDGFLANRLHALTVYSFYGDVFFDDPIAHIWTGLAKHAGGAVYGGLSDSLDGGPGTTNRRFQEGLLTGIDGIYNDLGWQFQAYFCGGLKSIDYAFSNRQIRFEVKNAWYQIHDGKPASQNIPFGHSPLLDTGSLGLARFEQEIILEDAFVILRAVIFGDGIPADFFVTQFAKNPVPGGGDFLDIVGEGALMSRFADRWTWITTEFGGMWWEWKNLGDLGALGRRAATSREFEEIVVRHLRFPPIR